MPWTDEDRTLEQGVPREFVRGVKLSAAAARALAEEDGQPAPAAEGVEVPTPEPTPEPDRMQEPLASVLGRDPNPEALAHTLRDVTKSCALLRP